MSTVNLPPKENNSFGVFENLPDNSNKSKVEKKAPTEEKRAKKVIQGNARTKKNEMRKLSDMFFMEDASSIGNYILMDVLVPSIKKALYDILVGSLDMSLFGGRGGKRPGADKITYMDYNSVSRRDDRSVSRPQSQKRYSYDDIILETRGEAEVVLERMDEIMETYGMVRVADLYDLVGISGEHTDNNYGWTNIHDAEILRVRGGGYTVKMPRARALR